MLIPIGFFGAGGAAAGSYELISTAYGTGSSSTITFSSIPSTYKHLQIRMTSRSSAANTYGDYRIRFNGISGTSYDYHWLRGSGTAVTSVAINSDGGIQGFTLGNSNTAGSYGVAVIDILNYSNTTTNKTVRILEGAMDYRGIVLRSGLFRNTAAVSSIELTESNGGSWMTASRFSLYGIKG